MRVEESEDVLPDGWAEVGLTNEEGLFRFSFEDLDGNLVSSSDARFEGRVILVNVFGSWCPNCNDEAPLLGEWDRRYGERGLDVVVPQARRVHDVPARGLTLQPSQGRADASLGLGLRLELKLQCSTL